MPTGIYKHKNRHRMSITKTYNTWRAMKARCLRKNSEKYKIYGNVGITICPEWLDFKNFFADMGKRPKGKTLDRKNNNKGYYKKNCRWATNKEQHNNTKGNVFLTYKGKKQTIAQWSDELEIKYCVIYNRLRYGWSVKRALNK